MLSALDGDSLAPITTVLGDEYIGQSVNVLLSIMKKLGHF